jgi:hypothetical protein
MLWIKIGFEDEDTDQWIQEVSEQTLEAETVAEQKRWALAFAKGRWGYRETGPPHFNCC